MSVAELEERLNDFDAGVRADTLRALMQAQPVRPVPAREVANMHCHTFFSFNAYGYSPSALAWLGRQRGYKLMGIVDFDVLDGVDEFLDACLLTEVHGSAGIETRVYLPEFADYEMNSPGEPGVLYHMGIGFTTGQVSAEARGVLAELREQSAQRNLGLLARVNAHLAPVTLDYAADVLPLTPSGNATERHITQAYARAAERHFPDAAARARFWADRLAMPVEAAEAMFGDAAALSNTVRSRLMKKGGVGYVQPGHETFPPIEKLTSFILACDALPCAAWLDGTTSGEQRIGDLLDLLVRKGSVALNIVPDRNWNLKDPDERRVKVQNLYKVVRLAQEMDLPLNVGTEMNSYGNKLVDDFDAAELKPVRQAFLDGAYFICGHTLLARALGMGYMSKWAKAMLPTRRERNAFYMQVGKALPPGKPGLERLRGITVDMQPRDILARIAE